MEKLSAMAPGDCAISTITAYELYTGVAKSQQPERERAKVTRLLSVVQVLAFDSAAAQKAAVVRTNLEAGGMFAVPTICSSPVTLWLWGSQS